MKFSKRGRWESEANRLTIELQQLMAAGDPVIDLTVSNPTAVGLDYPEEQLSRIAADAAKAPYRPDPRGLLPAREALAAYLSSAGDVVSPDDLILCASTSEAYSWLFKLLCDPGDEIVCGVPGYPLFEHLAELESVRLTNYHLRFDARWELDSASLRNAVGDRTKALIAVHPNNPTGSYVAASEQREMLDLASRAGLALISDEVFYDYPLSHRLRAPSFASLGSAVPTFALGGLSKLAGLPHWKLAWIRIAAPAAVRPRIDAALELIADTFLSVSTVAQASLPSILELVPSIRGSIHSRTLENLRLLEQTAAQDPSIRVLPAEGGWSAVVRVPRLRSEDDLVLGLLRDARLLVHPGYFFDFAGEGYLVVSLLGRPDLFAEGVKRLVGYVRSIAALPA